MGNTFELISDAKSLTVIDNAKSGEVGIFGEKFISDIKNIECKSFFEIVNEFQDQLNDDSSFYVGYHAVYSASKKIKNAVDVYGMSMYRKNKEINSSLDFDLVVLVDSTFFGSGKEGFLLTEDWFFGKYNKNSIKIKLKDIEKIYLDEDDRIIYINDLSIDFDSSLKSEKIQILVDCVKKYAAQFQ